MCIIYNKISNQVIWFWPKELEQHVILRIQRDLISKPETLNTSSIQSKWAVGKAISLSHWNKQQTCAATLTFLLWFIAVLEGNLTRWHRASRAVAVNLLSDLLKMLIRLGICWGPFIPCRKKSVSRVSLWNSVLWHKNTGKKKSYTQGNCRVPLNSIKL